MIAVTPKTRGKYVYNAYISRPKQAVGTVVQICQQPAPRSGIVEGDQGLHVATA